MTHAQTEDPRPILDAPSATILGAAAPARNLRLRLTVAIGALPARVRICCKARRRETPQKRQLSCWLVQQLLPARRSRDQGRQPGAARTDKSCFDKLIKRIAEVCGQDQTTRVGSGGSGSRWSIYCCQFNFKSSMGHNTRAREGENHHNSATTASTAPLPERWPVPPLKVG